MARLFVGNLSYNTTEDILKQALEEIGVPVIKVKIIMDRETGRPRGFAFIEIGPQMEASEVISMANGTYVDNRPIRVDHANERNDRPR